MHTTFTVKTDKKLHKDAKKTAEKLGIPLTTIINAKLKEFVREQAITVSARPTARPEKLAEWEHISDDMDKHPEKYPVYHGVDELFAHWEDTRTPKIARRLKKRVVHA
jgi:antitoxin component of RelBE/YafQ-DinJ toxin-antitoxin module